MRSGPACIDMDEAIEWIVNESRRRGKRIPVNAVSNVLCLYVEFQVLVGNVAVVVESSDDPIIIAGPYEGEPIREDFICPRCMLGLESTPDD